jgi:hypothetical protein
MRQFFGNASDRTKVSDWRTLRMLLTITGNIGSLLPRPHPMVPAGAGYIRVGGEAVGGLGRDDVA